MSNMSHSCSHELIAAVLNTDLTNLAMDAARRAGCHGGTLVKAREMGGGAAKKLFGLTVAAEKEILFILVPAGDKLSVMNAICETVLRESGEHAVAFSLPVDTVAGLQG